MSDSSDPYLYPGTDTLRNLAGIRDPERLATFEAQATIRRVLELRQQSSEGRFDTARLKEIHWHLFQDVYEWAGQFRTTVLGKAEFGGGPVHYFTAPHLLEHEAERIFDSLHRAGNVKGLSGNRFAGEAALLLSSLNDLHAFREGNGRCQREFVAAVAREAGQSVAFDVVSRERMVQASILSCKGDTAMMVRLFREITRPDVIAPLHRAIGFLERNHFNWNDTYIATTTGGREYSGRLVGRDQGAFMMRTDADQILIGHQADIPADLRSGDHLSFKARWTAAE